MDADVGLPALKSAMSDPVSFASTALQVAADHARQPLSEATQRAYRADWAHFVA